MGADKLAAVRATGAEVLTAADTSCLLHLGGMLSRDVRRSGAASRRDPRRSDSGMTDDTARSRVPPAAAKVRRHAAFPEAATTALADEELRRNLNRATHDPREAFARGHRGRGLGAAAACRCRDQGRRPRTPAGATRRARANVTAAGGVVHWARDAAEANAIVVGLVREPGADEVVKVKSMATQEIELNEALARPGIAAWETDLAELIVQLGRDLPSHFLVPAIHRNRTEIRDIFRREMAGVGRPAPDDLTDDPADLAEAARLHLREKFLRARVAISGANFAVAETGTVMVVESEGNGRMCLTLPDVLITVMGIEKLLPAWRDLEVFLQLLPRSSTAERMNPYTTMWTGVTPGDGPQAFHLVLLDNGRTDTPLGPGRPPGAAVHQVLRLPQRVPGVRADRWARLRFALRRPHRRDPDAPAAGHREAPGRRTDRLAARTRRRCAAPASRSARFGSTSRRSSSTFVDRS